MLATMRSILGSFLAMLAVILTACGGSSITGIADNATDRVLVQAHEQQGGGDYAECEAEIPGYCDEEDTAVSIAYFAFGGYRAWKEFPFGYISGPNGVGYTIGVVNMPFEEPVAGQMRMYENDPSPTNFLTDSGDSFTALSPPNSVGTPSIRAKPSGILPGMVRFTCGTCGS